MRPPANKNEMGSPRFDGLDESSESSKVIHLCGSFYDLGQYFSTNQFGLLFTARRMGGYVEPNLKDVRDCDAI